MAQGTPMRVLHRRSPLTRTKLIHSLVVRHLEGEFYVADMKTESGWCQGCQKLVSRGVKNEAHSTAIATCAQQNAQIYYFISTTK